ncbi:response regulator transcription factor [Ectobacillus antri]|jgi:two-component system NarL family response regulator|uniref:Response regulator transcription factor n=1 Tax=Ectobacillus antri TaxID=2486280 RepID=A0ABT6H1E5_9BACI|nr:response regulator transcription factor [Ectobacillus antri]MDG4656368.1 response regulator transcription factor [Ectobacillus antri]MDG5753043.1 response regulator transcription factor [Ectobacillus antri]
MRVLIVDDHPIVRKGLVFFLESQPGISFIHQANNGKEAYEMVQKERPDVILMDLAMPVMDGIEATKKIKEWDYTIKILILTSFSEQEYVRPALQAGADGYQLKDVEPTQLVAAIQAVYEGTISLHQKVSPVIWQHTAQQDVVKLTRREKEVLRELACGKSNKEIGAVLHITEQTVKTHVSNILMKLNLEDRTQAALYVVKNNISL